MNRMRGGGRTGNPARVEFGGEDGVGKLLEEGLEKGGLGVRVHALVAHLLACAVIPQIFECERENREDDRRAKATREEEEDRGEEGEGTLVESFLCSSDFAHVTRNTIDALEGCCEQ